MRFNSFNFKPRERRRISKIKSFQYYKIYFLVVVRIKIWKSYACDRLFKSFSHFENFSEMTISTVCEILRLFSGKSWYNHKLRQFFYFLLINHRFDQRILRVEIAVLSAILLMRFGAFPRNVSGSVRRQLVHKLKKKKKKKRKEEQRRFDASRPQGKLSTSRSSSLAWNGCETSQPQRWRSRRGLRG